MAWWIILVQMALYLAQQDYPGGLEFSHSEKGLVFFLWAILKNLTPLWSGPYIARNGTKILMAVGSFMGGIGYFLLIIATDIYGVLGCTALMGTGIGMFQNALQSRLAVAGNFAGGYTYAVKTAGVSRIVGWAGYQWVINLAVFIGGFVSAKLLDSGIENVFLTSSIIMGVVFLLTLTVTNAKPDFSNNKHIMDSNIRISLRVLQSDVSFRKNLMSFALFTFVYMQFYETLPNYLADWGDALSLGSAMAPVAKLLGDSLGELGFRIEYLYNLNALVTLFAIIPIAFLMRRFSPIGTYRIGLIVVALGLVMIFLGTTVLWIFLLFIIYTIGEAIVNPRILHIADIAGGDSEKKPIYLGLVYLSWAFGLGFGGLLGGALYDFATNGLLVEESTGALLFWVVPLMALFAAIGVSANGKAIEAGS